MDKPSADTQNAGVSVVDKRVWYATNDKSRCLSLMADCEELSGCPYAFRCLSLAFLSPGCGADTDTHAALLRAWRRGVYMLPRS